MKAAAASSDSAMKLSPLRVTAGGSGCLAALYRLLRLLMHCGALPAVRLLMLRLRRCSCAAADTAAAALPAIAAADTVAAALPYCGCAMLRHNGAVRLLLRLLILRLPRCYRHIAAADTAAAAALRAAAAAVILLAAALQLLRAAGDTVVQGCGAAGCGTDGRWLRALTRREQCSCGPSSTNAFVAKSRIVQ